MQDAQVEKSAEKYYTFLSGGLYSIDFHSVQVLIGITDLDSLKILSQQPIELYLLVLSADNFCKQLGPRSGLIWT